MNKNYFLILKGDIIKFPNISRTGKTFNANLIIKISKAYFQFNKINASAKTQSAQKTYATQDGGIGSLGGKLPLRFACVILISNVVIADVAMYKIVTNMIRGELMAVLNNVIIILKNSFYLQTRYFLLGDVRVFLVGWERLVNNQIN